MWTPFCTPQGAYPPPAPTMNKGHGAESHPDIIPKIRVQTQLTTIFTGQLQVKLLLHRILVTIVQTGLDKLEALDYGDC